MQRILIAEDSEDFQEIFVRAVREQFPTADIWVAKDGADAWEKFRTLNVDAVITDLLMPEMNGEQLAAKIREGDHNNKVPIVLVSSTPWEAQDKTLFTGIFNKCNVLEAVGSLKQQPEQQQEQVMQQ